MNVDQAGADDQAAGVDHDVGLAVASQRENLPVAEPKVGDLIDVLTGVDQSSPFDLDRRQRIRPFRDKTKQKMSNRASGSSLSAGIALEVTADEIEDGHSNRQAIGDLIENR